MRADGHVPRVRRLGVDVAAWRSSREFRLLLTSRSVTTIGSRVTFVAVPFQIKVLTGSFVAVGLVGAVEFLPIVVMGLYGGALADAVDRRRLVLGAEVVMGVVSALLVVDAALPHPMLWPIYVLAALLGAVNAVQEPAVDATLPRVVRSEEITGALALSTACTNVGQIGGPAAGGVLLAVFGPAVAYGVDTVSFAVSVVALAAMRPVPPPGGGVGPSVGGIVAGLRYAVGRQELLGTYAVDIAAMLFAVPTALLPFLADRLDADWALGLFYAAESVGALVVSVTSGWASGVRRHGRAVVYAAIWWGVSIAVLGVVGDVWLALVCLAVAGGADMVSGLFRSTIWSQTIPDRMRGRLAGVELLSYESGPVLGQLRGGAVAALVGVRAALWSGGLMCVVAVAVVAARLPGVMSYRADTGDSDGDGGDLVVDVDGTGAGDDVGGFGGVGDGVPGGEGAAPV